MRLRTLRKEFGAGIEVSRDRKAREVHVAAAGLKYQVQESRFGSERELAEHMKSKLPVVGLVPPACWGGAT